MPTSCCCWTPASRGRPLAPSRSARLAPSTGGCDNAGTHTPEGSKPVRAYLKKWGGRVKVHYLSKYSPDTNPIERVWWRLHEAVTRNHRCHTMDELLNPTFDGFETRTRFRVKSSVYAERPGK
ncbi:transposase [bacterium]|nr:transposase [bacterium]